MALGVLMAEPNTHNFHVPLEREIYSRLREEAKRSGQPATIIAREAIETFLERRRREALHRDIAAYAQAVAGSSDDLDSDLEEAAVEHLMDME
jgi:predicted transcriptional regulator